MICGKSNPSFFELTVAMAFDYFANQEIDVAVVEVGLGGRLDSTNIITPDLSIITNISFDHINLLGDTIEKIAGEKAGIIKADVPVIIGATQKETVSVFKAKAKEHVTSIYFADQEYKVAYSMLKPDSRQQLSVQRNGRDIYPKLSLDLLGQYQHKNIPIVLKAVDILNGKNYKITEENLREGLANVVAKTGLLGRWQVIVNNPLTVCDTGHNEDGIKAVCRTIGKHGIQAVAFYFRSGC